MLAYIQEDLTKFMLTISELANSANIPVNRVISCQSEVGVVRRWVTAA